MTSTVALGNASPGVILFSGASGNTIGGTASGAGNVISGNKSSGIEVSTSDILIEGNRIGTDENGNSAVGNTGQGIDIGSGASEITIGGTVAGSANVITGNQGDGLDIENAGTTGIVVLGNDIGTNSYGQFGLGNTGSGINVGDGASGITIGGTTTASANVISGNDNFGIWITGGSSQVTVEGNQIGTTVNGSYGAGNSFSGIQIDSASVLNTISGNVVSGNRNSGISLVGAGTSENLIQDNLIGTNLAGSYGVYNAYQGIYFSSGVTNNTIGGTTAGTGNVISANGNGGIWLNGASNNLVEGNLIGTDSTGTHELGNAYSGVYIDTGGSGNTIGGTTAGAGNVISANGNDGVVINGQGTDQNLVEGNQIGTDATGFTVAMGNALGGVVVEAGALNNTIGGTVAGAGNVIAFNGGNGVTVGQNATDTAAGNAVLQNTIFANTKLGLNLGDDGVTQNDSGGHTGPNLFEDFPVLSSVATANGATNITGTLSANPNSTYRIEFFSSVAEDSSRYGQGQTFLTFADVTTGGDGTASFSVQTPNPVNTGLFISATATDANGNTSEFSADIVNSPGTFTSVSWTGVAGDNLWSDPANWSDDQVPGAGEDVSINLSGSFTIIYPSGAGTTAIDSLTGSDNLSVTGGSLAIIGSASLSGKLTIAGGSLTLGSSSVLSGQVWLDGGSLNNDGAGNTITGNLSVVGGSTTITGTGAPLTVSGQVNVGAGFVNSSGAGAIVDVSGSLTFPFNVIGKSWTVENGATFTASGPVTLAEGGFEVLSGGTVNLLELTSISESSEVSIIVRGSGSLVNLPALTSFNGASDLQVTTGAAVMAPLLTTMNGLTVSLDGTGTIQTSQWKTLTNGELVINGGDYVSSFAFLSDFDGSSIAIRNGASVALPAVTSYNGVSPYGSSFDVDGAGSLLDLSSLTKLTAGVAQLTINISNGGTLIDSNLNAPSVIQNVSVFNRLDRDLHDYAESNLRGD